MKRERMKFVRPFAAFVWRASMGYTVAIRRRIPGEEDKEVCLGVLDMSHSEAERLRALLEGFFKTLPKEHVGFGSVLRGVIKHQRGAVLQLERELAEAKKRLGTNEAKLRLVAPLRKPLGRAKGRAK